MTDLGSLENAIADFAFAVRNAAPDPTPDAALRDLRARIASHLSMAREDGGRIALGLPDPDAELTEHDRLGQVVAESLAMITEHAGRVAGAVARLSDEADPENFDPEIGFDVPFRRAVADLLHQARIAERVNPLGLD